MAYDGVVSRYLNRPISRPLARACARTALTPNMLTAATLLLAAVAAGVVASGANIAGGILIQAASVADGIDGELARMKSMATRFGAIFDAITDRYADALMIGGMTIYAARFEPHGHPEFAGMLALAGSLAVSYSRARIEASMHLAPSDGLFGLASRDARSLVAAVGTVLGQCWWTLIILAVASGLTVAWRLAYLRFRHAGHPAGGTR